MAHRVILVGCVKQKRSIPSAAKDLYRSELFKRRRAYAELTGAPWFILSALYGLLDPEAIVDPYNMTLEQLSAAQRIAWGQRTVKQLEERFSSLDGLACEVHAGDKYVAAVEEPLTIKGALVMRPLRGLRFGEQLQWYDRHKSITFTIQKPNCTRRLDGFLQRRMPD